MNPFKYGGVVSGEFFYNRVDDVKRIKADIQNGNNLIIYAPRRYGKTSLIIKILSELENESINTIYIDFFNVIDQKKFLEIYSIKVLQKQKLSVEKAMTQFRSFVRNLVPSVTFDKDGNPSFQINFQENIGAEKSFEDVVNLPEKMSVGKKWVVVFDEFQEINRLNGDNFEKQLRAVIQFHKNVSYVFMGSKTHLLLNMFRDKSRAFYNVGKIIKVEKIPEDETIKFLTERFADFNLTLTKDSAEYIINVSENIPYYIQFIAAEAWQTKVAVEHPPIEDSYGKADHPGWINEKTKIEKKDIDTAVNRLIDAQSDYYLELYSNLSSYQKKVLFAISESGSNIFSKEYTAKYGLSSGSSTQRAVQKIVDLAIVEKSGEEYLFSDPFFKKYIQLRFKA